MEPWVSVELDGAWISRFAVNPGTSRMCIFRGAAPGRAKHVRLLKDVQAMSEDPAHPLHTGPLLYPGVWPGSGGAQRRAGGRSSPTILPPPTALRPIVWRSFCAVCCNF